MPYFYDTQSTYTDVSLRPDDQLNHLIDRAADHRDDDARPTDTGVYRQSTVTSSTAQTVWIDRVLHRSPDRLLDETTYDGRVAPIL